MCDRDGGAALHAKGSMQALIHRRLSTDERPSIDERLPSVNQRTPVNSRMLSFPFLTNLKHQFHHLKLDQIE